MEELKKKLRSSERKVSMLQHQVEQLLRRVYGRRSERLDPNQLMLDPLILEAINEPAPSPEPIAPLLAKPERKGPHKTKRKKHPGRIPIPEHLERVEIVLDVPEEQKTCPDTGKPLKQIGWEVSEKLEYRPGKLIVNVYKRPKYGASESDVEGPGVVIAPMPDHPIDRCKADVGLLSYIIVSKFADHLPLYRQNGIFEREGVDIPRGTQTSWILQTYEAIRPLGDELKRAVLESDVMYDAFLFSKRVAAQKSYIVRDLGLVPGNYYLATIHRQENTDAPERLGNIFKAFDALATKANPLLIPLHPRTKKALEGEEIGSLQNPFLRIIPPAGYLDMIALETNARVILTDSGGVQKEAYFVKHPCVTLRDETEWVATVKPGGTSLQEATQTGSFSASRKRGRGEISSFTATAVLQKRSSGPFALISPKSELPPQRSIC